MCLHRSGFMTLGPARSWCKAECRHKSGTSASRCANDGQNCGSAKYGAIRKVSYLIKKAGEQTNWSVPQFFSYTKDIEKSDNTLCVHSIYNFFKAGNVCACYVIAFHTVTLCSICSIVADIDHDLLQFGIYFFEGPA